MNRLELIRKQITKKQNLKKAQLTNLKVGQKILCKVA